MSDQRLIGAHLPAVHPERRETQPGRCSGCLTRFTVDVRLPLPATCPDCGGDVVAPGGSSRWGVACRSRVRVDPPVGEATSSAVEVAASGPGGFSLAGPSSRCPPFNAIRLSQQHVKDRSATVDTLCVVFRGGGRHVVLQGIAVRTWYTRAAVSMHAARVAPPAHSPLPVRSPCRSGS